MLAETKGKEMKFRKKPIVIEATQFLADYPFTHQQVNYSEPQENCKSSLDGKHWVQTMEGPLIVSEGDWIITGIKGEHYPCKPDIFAATYEPA